MPRARGSKDYIALTQGLITEASPLAFPEGATSDEQNFLLNTNGGTRQRRKGLENNLGEFSIAGDGGSYDSRSIVETYYWEAPNLLLVIYNEARSGSGTMRSIIRFHRGTLALTELAEYVITSTGTASVDYSVSGSTNFVTLTSDQNEDPILLEYNSDLEEVKVYAVQIAIRDFELITDRVFVSGDSITNRPFLLTEEHEYNLLNSGWYARRKLDSTHALGDPILAFFTESNQYPSNADSSILGMKINEDGDNEWSFDALSETPIGNSENPRGHYVFHINDFDRNDIIADPTSDGAGTTIILKDTVDVS